MNENAEINEEEDTEIDKEDTINEDNNIEYEDVEEEVSEEEQNEVMKLEEIADLLKINPDKFLEEYEENPIAWQDKYLTIINNQKQEALDNMIKSEWVKIENEELKYMNTASEIFGWLVKFGDYQTLPFSEVENLMAQLKEKRDRALLLQKHTDLYGENILKYIKLLSAEKLIYTAVLEYQEQKIKILEKLLLKYYKLTEESKKMVDFDVVSI